MPQFANITVKKNDGTTDVVYTGVQPAAGNLSPAIWEGPQGTAPAHRARLQIGCKPNAQKTVRRVAFDFEMPITAVGADGSVNVVDKMIHSSTSQVPQRVATADVNEFAAQCANLYKAALVQEILKSQRDAV